MNNIATRVEHFLHTYPLISFEKLLNHPLSDLKNEDSIWDAIKNAEGKVPFGANFIRLFIYVRNLHKELFNALEGKLACTQKPWQAHPQESLKKLEGGGVMTIMREQILEKSAVNMSLVFGPSYPALEGEHAGKPFAACGVSLISHPKNPNCPIMHLNIRVISVGEGDSNTTWIGGGADLTPMVEFAEDTNLFHSHMKNACTNNPGVGNYEHFKKWADEYFYIPHRNSSRGVGGIFFDYVPLESEAGKNFLLDVGQQAAHAYAKIIALREVLPYDENLQQQHLYWRGRYAEFNLVYDRGTRFGLLTGGNTEAILCSLPPRVNW